MKTHNISCIKVGNLDTFNSFVSQFPSNKEGKVNENDGGYSGVHC